MLVDLVHKYDTDKTVMIDYLLTYEKHFAPIKDHDIRLLELGVYKCGSLYLWRDYFTCGSIVGLDASPYQLNDPSGRIKVYQGFQQDTALLERIGQECAPNGFDIIIDDCSHIAEYTRISFWHLFDRWLKPGGIFAIEDWGTGYWDSWLDGKNVPRSGETAALPQPTPSLLKRMIQKLQPQKEEKIEVVDPKKHYPSHDYGMVGFIKELVDEVGMPDISGPGWGITPFIPSRFQFMEIHHGLVIIVKRNMAAYESEDEE